MKPIYNRILVGLLSGIIASSTVALLLYVRSNDTAIQIIEAIGGLPVVLLSGLLTGIVYALIFRSLNDGFYSDMMKGVVLGVAAWILLGLNIYPAVMSGSSMWETAVVGTIVPKLFAHLILGGLVGALYGSLIRLLSTWLAFSDNHGSAVEVKQRVVILGGGYAGVAAAEALDKYFVRDPSVSISLVSDINYLIHTPMLSEVSASALDARHISPSLRSSFQRVQVVQGTVERVDIEAKMVRLEANRRLSERGIPFDYLVVTSGSVPNFFGNQGVEENCFTFKSVEDAELLRNQLIEMFERADFESDETLRKEMLTFVVAGGGFAGVELIGAINDFARGMLPYYPNLSPDDVRMVLVHSRGTILPELSAELGKYAQRVLADRGVEFVLNTRVTGAEPGRVLLGDDTIASQTFVWTAGNRPSPILESIGTSLTQRGQLDVSAELAVKGLLNVWAAGDCAQVPDPNSRTGYSPPTAQHASRQGKVAGRNVVAAIKGRHQKPFNYKAVGSLAALGHQIAVAEIMGYRFSGFLAWMMWRGIYLAKLPTLQKQVRVGLDWILDIFFPPDIVQTINFHKEELRLEKRAEQQVAQRLEQRLATRIAETAHSEEVRS